MICKYFICSQIKRHNFFLISQRFKVNSFGIGLWVYHVGLLRNHEGTTENVLNSEIHWSVSKNHFLHSSILARVCIISSPPCALNICKPREPSVARSYRYYWKCSQIYSLMYILQNSNMVLTQLRALKYCNVIRNLFTAFIRLRNAGVLMFREFY